MSRLWVLPVLGLIAARGIACSDEKEDNPQSASPTAALTSITPATTATAPAATTQPTPPPDWEVYEDPGANYSLRYPAYLEPQYRSSGGTSSTQFSDGASSNLGFVISVQDAAGLSLEDWFAAYNACLPETSPKTRQIAGEQALICTASVLDGILEETAAIEHRGKVIYVSSTLTTDEFESVISTLELTAP